MHAHPWKNSLHKRPRHTWTTERRTNVARMLEDEERRRHDPHPPMVERERAPVPVTLAGYDRARTSTYDWSWRSSCG